MARPLTGSPRWNARKRIWEARVTPVEGGARHVVPMPGIGEDEKGRAADMARKLAERARQTSAVPVTSKETVNEWFARYFTWREDRPQAETIADRRTRITKWVSPIIGTIPMVDVTDEDLRAVVAHLDEAVSREDISWKTAANIWGEVTKGFSDACELNEKALRVRRDDPSERVRGPQKGDLRRKPFLRPDELTALYACREIPVYRRRLYAVAACTALRIGELRGLHVEDVDLGAGQLHVVRQASRLKREKGRTKTGRARTIPIEPVLRPLLTELVRGRGRAATLLEIRNEDHARLVREDLVKAGCTRAALTADDDMRAPFVFHGFRDTCLTHMAVRRDAPQDVQWRAGHTTPIMTERYIAQAQFEAGKGFGEPFPPIPLELVFESVYRTDSTQETTRILCEGRELNPYRSYPTGT